jgi:lipopolysaccharide transport system permease protein
VLTTVIEPTTQARFSWKELKTYRELLYYFAWRDIKVRYKQSVIGASWAVFQPLLSTLIFAAFLGRVSRIATSDVPYVIFAFTGLIYWNFFSAAMTRASNSLVDNQSVVTKVYFPRMILPLATTVVGFVDFCFAFLVFIAMMLIYRIMPGVAGLLFLIPSIVITFIAAAGIGSFLGAMNVKYRDIKQIVPFFVQIGMFVTPVIYPITMIPQKYQWILYLNPVCGVITAMRAWWLHNGQVNVAYLTLSIVMAFVFLFIGLAYFKAREREFADRI